MECSKKVKILVAAILVVGISTAGVIYVVATTTTTITNCKQLRDMGKQEDGIHNITIGEDIVPVYCDISNGGWIVLQRRYDGSVDFNQHFDDYSKGFGNLDGEVWIGLETMHQLTSRGRWKLRIDLGSGVEKRNNRYEEYEDFTIGVGPGFILNYDGFGKGSAGDSLRPHRGRRFSTADFDQDGSDEMNCAKEWSAGWWFPDQCSIRCLLNGGEYNTKNAIYWQEFISYKSKGNLKSSSMKIIPI